MEWAGARSADSRRALVGVGGLRLVDEHRRSRVGAVSAAMLVAMAAMFVAALAVPDAFGSHGVLFGVAFLIVNVMHLTLYALSARGDPDLLAAILRVAPWALLGAALIIVAGFVDGGLKPMLWLAALAVAYFGPLVRWDAGWRVQPAHFVERHGLIVIIAIGESLIAIGLGEDVSGLSTEVIVAAVLGFAVHDRVLAGVLRLLHDPRPPAAERPKRRRARHARSRCLHPPALSDGGRNRPLCVRDEDDARGRRRRARHHPGARALRRSRAVPVRLRRAPRARVSHARRRTPDRSDCLALLWPVALVVPALVALTLVATVWVGLHAYEIIWWREARAQTRALRAS